ncbi:response regulator [Caballeronia sp. LjRoot29]|uniref:response regulator n=1 Tax=Caballeronia sp. LjRoot29 TaxID=3342315 RepID=UPI003ED15B5B
MPSNLESSKQPYLKSSLSRAWTDRRIAAYTEPLRVLVVDDNINGAEALAAYLSLDPVECRIALSGAQAIKMATAWLPDVIVMDISMPGLNGLEATHALRRDLRTSSIVIIAFTALDEAEVLRHLLHTSFDGYCQKGQSPLVLVALIDSFGRQPRSRQW